MVQMEVRLPPEMEADDLKARERARSQELQRDGSWVHLWRVAGRYANVSVFDVGSPDELHELLSSLPLFPYIARDSASASPVQARFNRLRRRGD